MTDAPQIRGAPAVGPKEGRRKGDSIPPAIERKYVDSRRRARRGAERKGRVNPLKSLIDECANASGDGHCKGIDLQIDGTGEVRQMASPADFCLVRHGQRCRYFEKVVLPLVKTHAEYAGADSEYQQKHGIAKADAQARKHPFFTIDPRAGEAVKRVCKDCGGPRPKGRRYCAACAEKRRRVTRKAATRKWRQSAGGV